MPIIGNSSSNYVWEETCEGRCRSVLRNIKDTFEIEPAGKTDQDEFFSEPYMEAKEDKSTNPTQKIKVFVGTPMTARVSESADEGKTHEIINNEEWIIEEINDKNVK